MLAIAPISWSPAKSRSVPAARRRECRGAAGADVLGEMALAGESVRRRRNGTHHTDLTVISPEYLGERLRHADPLLRTCCAPSPIAAAACSTSAMPRAARRRCRCGRVDAGLADREHAYPSCALSRNSNSA